MDVLHNESPVGNDLISGGVKEKAIAAWNILITITTLAIIL